jgi:hypothetical protein
MYIYVSSIDSLDTYSANNASSFTSCLSEEIDVESASIGLCELSITPKNDKNTNKTNTASCDQSSKDESSTCTVSSNYVFIMLPQCTNSEAHGHKHPIIRLVGLNEFTHDTSVIRFPDVVYIPFRVYKLSHITVWIRPVPERSNENCCVTSNDIVSGITRCTFHVKWDV